MGAIETLLTNLIYNIKGEYIDENYLYNQWPGSVMVCI